LNVPQPARLAGGQWDSVDLDLFLEHLLVGDEAFIGLTVRNGALKHHSTKLNLLVLGEIEGWTMVFAVLMKQGMLMSSMSWPR
jgi:hypothetical protein